MAKSSSLKASPGSGWRAARPPESSPAGRGRMLLCSHHSGWATLGTSCFHQGHIQFARNRDRGLLDFAYHLHNVIDTVYFQAVFRLKCCHCCPAGCHVWMSLFSVLSHPPTLTDLDPQLQDQVVRWGESGVVQGDMGAGREAHRISFITATAKSRGGYSRATGRQRAGSQEQGGPSSVLYEPFLLF